MLGFRSRRAAARLGPVVAAGAAVAALLVPVPPAAAAVPVLVVEGRGFGHGVGMAQDGAYWMGRRGATTGEILGQFYPGTTMARGSGNVRIPLLDAGGPRTAVRLVFPDGGEVRDGAGVSRGPGFPVRVAPGGAVTVHADGNRLRVEGGQPASTHSSSARPARAAAPRPAPTRPAPARPAQTEPLLPPASSSTTTLTTAPASSTTTTTRPGLLPPSSSSTTTTTTPPAGGSPSPPAGGGGAPEAHGSVWAVPDGGGRVGVPDRERRYRGVVEATTASGSLRLVNEVDVETYLKGMGEVRDPRWPPAALQAQAVAARTYALRAMHVGGELCDTQRCQVYLGADAEYAAQSRAVDATHHQVLAYGNRLASAVYSANAGGHTASGEEGFGVPGGGAPYLRPAPYPTADPFPWSVTVALRDVAARLSYAGALTGATVSRKGPSGRALEVLLDGDAGSKPVSGIAFARALGLRSTLFGLRTDVAAMAPEAPPSEDVLQALPDDAAAAAEAEMVEAGRAERQRLADLFAATAPAPTGTAAARLHPTADKSDGVAAPAAWAAVFLALVVTLLMVPARAAIRRRRH